MDQFDAEVPLKDGSLVRVRGIEAKEGTSEEYHSLMAGLIDRLSPETLLLRFSGSPSKETALSELVAAESGGFALVALRENQVIAHAGCYFVGPGKAEVAVVVQDDYQGLGLGTILVGQLAEVANGRGIEQFEAMVVPENYKMVKVLHELGFPTSLKVEPGLIRVTFPTSIRLEVLELYEKREATAAAAAVRSFFYPRAVAVVGASRERNTIGGELFHNILDSGFNGPVFPVNQSASMVQSQVAYRSILECPGNVDLAIVVVPASEVLKVTKECVSRGVRSLVVISAGFSEAGPAGVILQRKLLDVCSEAGMRLIGPNCMGIVNTDPEVRLNAQFAPIKPEPGRMGFLSQSGALGIAVIEHANRLGLGMSTFVSVGNKADISSNDLIQYWADDDKTDLILLYLESFGNPRKFARISKRITKNKPILAVKSGRSAAGFRATQSHTGAILSASDVTVDALFKQSGVLRADTLAEMFDIASLLSTQPVPRGDGLAIITNAGGAGILAADACEDLGLKVPETASKTQSALREFLPTAAGVKNPIDMIASATPEQYARAIRTVAEDPEVDAILVIFVPPIAITPEQVAARILEETRRLERRLPVLTTFMATHGVSEVLSDGSGTRVPSYPFPEAAVRALSSAVQYGRWLASPQGTFAKFGDVRKEEAAAIVAKALLRIKESEKKEVADGVWLSPQETENLLSCYGIPLVQTVASKTPEEAARSAVEISANSGQSKVVLKGVADGLVHKTDAGAVQVGLSGEADVKAAAKVMAERLRKMGYKLSGFLVQPMVENGIEMLVGVVSDPVFGPVLACGAGGVLVELMKDVAVRVTPVTVEDVHGMLHSLRTFPLLTGYRGGEVYDVEALVQTMLKVGALVEDMHEIVELDLNPLIVNAKGKGVAVVDARVRVAEAKPSIPIGAKRR